MYHREVFVLNIFLNYFLIPKYGIVGAAIATTTSISVVNLIRLGMVLLIMKIHPYKLSYLKPLFAGLSGSFLVFLGFRLIITGSSIFLLILLGVSFCIYSSFSAAGLYGAFYCASGRIWRVDLCHVLVDSSSALFHEKKYI